jgi:iron complex outermembrane recepter protein
MSIHAVRQTIIRARASSSDLSIQLTWGLIATVLASSAIAQQADEGTLQEVVVTATKRAEPLQNVPEAVSAITGEALQAMGADSFTDYARTIPSLAFTDAGAGREKPSIRGLNASVGEDTVGYYIGETPLQSVYLGSSPNPALIDIDRIEVLRGPQGTLYGSGSIGGTIKVIPNAPNLSKFEGEIQGSGMVTQGADGTSPGGSGSLVLNIPVVDGIAAVRGVVWGRDIGGFIDRTYGYAGGFGTEPHPTGTVGNVPDEHTWGFRGMGLIQPTEQFSISAMIYTQDQHFDGFQDITGGATNPDNRLEQNLISNVAEPQDNQLSLYSITVNYNFGPFALVSSTGYSSDTTIAVQEGTSGLQLALGVPAFPNAAYVHAANYNFTQETRLATTERVYGFDAVVGVYRSNSHITELFYWDPAQYDAVAAGNNPANPLYAPGNNLFDLVSRGYERQTAEFGELTYHFNEALRATAGLRHFDIANGTDSFADGLFAGAYSPQYTSLSASAEGIVYKGNVSYDVAKNQLVYAQFTEGFRPGFGNSSLPSFCTGAPLNSQEVQPDSIKNYEIGAKTTWLDKRLTFNAALYRINWSKIQQEDLLACGFSYDTNFGDAVIKGAEIEMRGQLSNRMSAGVSGDYISARLQQGDPTLGALAGDQIENVPGWQFALYGMTTFPILLNDDGYARLDYQYTGSSWGNYNRLNDGARDPASENQVTRLLNLKSGMHYGAWEYSVSGTNLLNQIAIQSVDPNASITFAIPGRPRYVVNRPRTFFLNLAYKF